MTHRDVAWRIDKFYCDLRLDEDLDMLDVPGLVPPEGDDMNYYRDRLGYEEPHRARLDAVTRILMEAYGQRDANGIVRPEI